MDLRHDLEAAVADRPEPSVPWHRIGLQDLVEHIVERYHRPLDEELPRLAQMMDKVLSVHGERHPELAEVSRTFARIQEELRPHMLKEERVLFPYVTRLESLVPEGALDASPFGSIENPIAVMVAEHETVGEELVRLLRLAADYNPPEGACNTFRGLFHGFAELERELHEHIHVENNILFPRAQALEAQIIARNPRRSA